MKRRVGLLKQQLDPKKAVRFAEASEKLETVVSDLRGIEKLIREREDY